MNVVYAIWYALFPNFTCHVCGRQSVPFFARWYGLYHCEECGHDGWVTRRGARACMRVRR